MLWLRSSSRVNYCPAETWNPFSEHLSSLPPFYPSAFSPLSASFLLSASVKQTFNLEKESWDKILPCHGGWLKFFIFLPQPSGCWSHKPASSATSSLLRSTFIDCMHLWVVRNFSFPVGDFISQGHYWRLAFSSWLLANRYSSGKDKIWSQVPMYQKTSQVLSQNWI